MAPTFHATRDNPVTVHYCKANLKSGNTVRVTQGDRQLDTPGVTFSGVRFDADMTHGNSTGPARRSGARCVLVVRRGVVRPLAA